MAIQHLRLVMRNLTVIATTVIQQCIRARLRYAVMALIIIATDRSMKVAEDSSLIISMATLMVTERQTVRLHLTIQISHSLMPGLTVTATTLIQIGRASC